MGFGRPLPPMSFYTFGTMSIGGDPARFDAHMDLVRQAVAAGVCVHTSRKYASVDEYNVLGRALRQAPGPKPPVMAKIRCYTAQTIQFDVEDTLELLGLDHLAVAQLSKRNGERKEIVADFLQHGPMWQTCCRLRDQGKVGSFVLELFTSCSPEGLEAVQAGLFDGYAFYFSVIDREVSNTLWRALEARQASILSIRSVGGGKILPAEAHKLRTEQPDHYYLRRLADLEPVFARSKCADWMSFALGFLAAHRNLITTVGGTSRPEHLEEFLAASRSVRPLAAPLVAEIHDLQSRWMEGF